MKNRIYILFGLLMAISFHTVAQQQPSFMQYMYNTLTINPAYAGYHRSPVFNLSGTSQFNGINGNPRSAAISAHGNAFSDRVGLGALLMTDKIGVTSTTNITGCYSYNLIENKRSPYDYKEVIPHVFSLGLQVGMNIYRENFSQLDVDYDPDLGEDLSTVVPSFGFGMYYSKNRYHLGLSIPQLLNAKLGGEARKMNIRRHIYVEAGKQFKLGQEHSLDLNTLIKLVQGAPMQVDLNGIVTLKKLVNVGLGYSSASTMNLMVGCQLGKSLRFGYFYGHPVGNSLKNYGGRHEIMLMLKAGKRSKRV